MMPITKDVGSKKGATNIIGMLEDIASNYHFIEPNTTTSKETEVATEEAA